ncbi:MAG: phenylalanine--tRNA ligase subunit beta [Bacilli bacterium]|jgi:phenylalanyl-tRNA synthetase beta chain|nr:phenylalanine--tRNA ligase subunit beta [Bacilli bacterium]MCH4210589.1 phenylalanine--tRNA ligase subunit beta [Bacilli bacterium]MCH4228547.1 phenylalanine--tRNA ligase subunit beta [Bacilli bacterium]MCH4277317.1 phenylalanine--tRNA ligase subunit beta [Bacilli bacterium]MCI2055229.1 phenylalanine--tRNA ligase subunit beta [Bacilli bacterium]
MKVSLNWLSQYVKVDDIDPKDLASKLTFSGVEVEDIEKVASGTNLVIGEILSCEKHPDSDHLHVLNVNEGKKYGVHQIVCGAPNARKGLRVIVAREGAVLPAVTIEKSEIRGVESDGMCCALYELGVDKKNLSEKQLSGIEELPLDAPIGEENVLAYLGLDDTVLDLKLLPNRPDLNAMENVAREVGCLYNREVKIPDYPAIKTVKTNFTATSSTEKCPLFAIREVKGVKVGPSPLWMKKALENEGVRSINNVVDIGNYVMLLTGQPLNMYDLDKLPEEKLDVIDDYEGDFVAMDDKTYHLEKGDLLVSSDGKGMCLAGIMTSKFCAVSEDSVNIAIEAAVFAGASIRHTSNRLGLFSESSARFVKGLNKDQAERVLEIASSLLSSLCSAESVSETSLFDNLTHEVKIIETSLSYINGRLGTSFSMDEVKDVLTRDNLQIIDSNGDSFALKIPSYRIDMVGEADVSEEVIRLLGYDKVTSKLPTLSIDLSGGENNKQKKEKLIRRYLALNGLDECVSYSLVNEKSKDAFSFLDDGECYKLLNPMTPEHEYYRKSLLPSLLDVASYNYARQNKDLALFEISSVTSMKKSGDHLSIVLIGEEKMQGSLKKQPYSFYTMKGYLEGILSIFGIGGNRYKLVRLSNSGNELHPGRSAEVLIGKTRVAVLGELHPLSLKEHDLGKIAVVLELDISALSDLKTSSEKAVIPSKFPSVSRDFAFLIGKDVSYEEIKREICRSDKLINKVEIFDLYEGVNIAPDKKSVAITITFLSEEKTLKDEEIKLLSDKVIGLLKIRFNAEIRS